jgi:DNA polymerase-4
VTDRLVKSISHEQTFGADLEDPQVVRQVLLGQVEQVARRLRRNGRKARAVALKIRFGDFQTIHRSATLDTPADETAILWQASAALFDQWVRQSYQPVRLIGMGAEQLTDSEGQLALFADPQRSKQRQLDVVTDQIVARFGAAAIARAGGLPRRTQTGFEKPE